MGLENIFLLWSKNYTIEIKMSVKILHYPEGESL